MKKLTIDKLIEGCEAGEIEGTRYSCGKNTPYCHFKSPFRDNRDCKYVGDRIVVNTNHYNLKTLREVYRCNK